MRRQRRWPQGASVGCLVGVGFTLIKAAHSQGTAAAALVALAVLSVVVSWAVVQSVFMLRYARMYYGDPVGGIDCNDEPRPNFLDFAYLAFTIGMTYQVSDTASAAGPCAAPPCATHCSRSSSEPSSWP